MADDWPMCGVCGDLPAENAKPSPWSGALLCHDCASLDEGIDSDDVYHQVFTEPPDCGGRGGDEP